MISIKNSSRRGLLLSGVIGCSLCLNAQVPETIEQVYAPVKVATPPSDAYIGLSMLENGEIQICLFLTPDTGIQIQSLYNGCQRYESIIFFP